MVLTTEKLYEQKPYETNFVAKVLACEECGDHYEVVLDQTLFYPTGGGQPCDTGMLDGTQVRDVQARDGAIVHIVQQPMEVGADVVGTIDWKRRFDFMQQHTAEHLISGIAHTLYGVDNVGFHLGTETVTVDLSLPLSDEALKNVEHQANQAIWANVPVQCTYPREDTLELIKYRSKKEIDGPIRLVQIPGFDSCACCGTHVARTGEIGLVKICSFERFHGGVRLEIVAGQRAYDYVSMCAEQNRAISMRLSARISETSEAVRWLMEENEANKARLAALEKEAFAKLAEQYRGVENPLVIAEGLTPDGLRRLANAVMVVCKGYCAAFSGSDHQGYHYVLGRPNGDVKALAEKLNAALDGRGGGRPDFVEGHVRAQRADVEGFFTQNP